MGSPRVSGERGNGCDGRVLNVVEADTKKYGEKFITINIFKLGECHQNEGEEQKMAEVYRQKLKEDYDGAVFGSKVPKDPPLRGTFGEARIDLKEGAVPVRQKPLLLHVERFEAHKKVTRIGWIIGSSSQYQVERQTRNS